MSETPGQVLHRSLQTIGLWQSDWGGFPDDVRASFEDAAAAFLAEMAGAECCVSCGQPAGTDDPLIRVGGTGGPVHIACGYDLAQWSDR